MTVGSISTALILLPAFIACVYCGGVGGTPRGMHLAVVNHETDCADWTGDVDCNTPRSLSCLFLDQMREQTLRPVGITCE